MNWIVSMLLPSKSCSVLVQIDAPHC
jgi:hypothetical protein